MGQKDKEKRRSSLDEFVCMGRSKERLSKALELALYGGEVNMWSVLENRVYLKNGALQGGWNALPTGANAQILTDLFWPTLLGLPSKYQGQGPDGSSGFGWHVSVDTLGTIVLEAWTLFYAK